MARLLWWDGHCEDACDDSWDDCSATTGFDDDCDCDDVDAKKRERRRKLIPIRNISVDCTPVVFRTPGQVRNVVSCPVSRTVTVPVTGGGTVPVTTTVNVPPVISPVAHLPCGC